MSGNVTATARPTGPQLYRLTRMAEWLMSGRHWNRSHAVEEFEVSSRTVMDDINYLRDYFGYDIEYDRATRSYVLRSDSGNLTSLQLRRQEWAAIHLAEHIYESLGALPMAEAVGAIAERVRRLMPELLGSNPTVYAPSISLLRGPAPAEPLPFVDVLDEAVQHQRTIRMTYYTAYRHATSERDVDPYQVIVSDSRGYLVGWCHRREEVAIFRLDRIRECEPTDDHFAVASDFDLKEFLGPMFGIFKDRETFHLRVRFSPYVAHWIKEDVWHPTQQLTPLPDGSVQVDMDVTGHASVKKWLLSFGSDCEVLEPQFLRRDVEFEVDKMVEFYGR